MTKTAGRNGAMANRGTFNCQMVEKSLGSSRFRRYDGREMTARIIRLTKAWVWRGGIKKRKINQIKMKKPKPISQLIILV